ncbi:MAG: shikimate kinase [Hyphomicrobiaceae bacterium]|jgi:shikimate kinase
MGRPGSDLTHIVLTGFMASGKTAVGRTVARRLGWDFIDLDHFIEAKEGRSVAEIFSTDGEAAFRDIENRAVVELALERSTVLATGGGTFTFERNRKALRELGVVVCLVTKLETILERAGRNSKRPLAQGPGADERLASLYEERLPSYRKADVLVETEGLTVHGAAARVIAMLAPRLRDAQRIHDAGHVRL